ncbi:MAG: DUF6056 family protein [Oscillospiraceae bacterium]|jgi:hypothetical protein|nr:DUF6056 family protein [Oscillospiraceae bacterium]
MPLCEHLRAIRRSPWRGFGLTCAGIVSFFIALTRSLLKTDDGHFLGILHTPGFRLRDWLAARRTEISGRTVGEGLLMTFLRGNPFWWKLCSAAFLCLLVWFLCRLALAIPGGQGKGARLGFACASAFLVLPTCLSAAAFWFAGSFTYLWPLGGLLLSVLPAAFRCLDLPVRRWMPIAAVLAAPLAAAEEQTAAAALAALLLLQGILLLRRRWRWSAALPLLPAGVGAWFLLTAPGARLRSGMEAQSGFTAFLTMSLPEKLLCGLSNYAAYALFLSAAVMTAFLLPLYCQLRQAYPGRGMRRLTLGHGLAWGILCAGGNAVYFAVRRSIPDQGFQWAWQTAGWRGLGWPEGILLALSAVFLLSVLTQLLLLARKRPTAGMGAGLCCAASLCCGVLPGLSGSLYASGQRIFFFSDVFLLLAANLLFGGAEDTKVLRTLRKGTTVLAALFCLVNVLGYAFLEIPPMG